MNSKQQVAAERVAATFQLDPVVTLKRGDTTYQFELDNVAVKNILLATGINVLAKSYSPSDLEDPGVLSTVVLLALKRHHPEITQEEVDTKVISLRHLPAILSALMQIQEVFLPDMSDLESAVESVSTGGPTENLDPQ